MDPAYKVDVLVVLLYLLRRSDGLIVIGPAAGFTFSSTSLLLLIRLRALSYFVVILFSYPFSPL